MSGVIREYDRNVRDPNATNMNDFWEDTASNTTMPAANQFYRDPEPMPKIYLQLQPQLQSATSGLGEAVAQVQFEVDIDLEMMGQCPSVLEAANLTGQAMPDTAAYSRRWIDNLVYMMPLFYPIQVNEVYAEESKNNVVETVQMPYVRQLVMEETVCPPDLNGETLELD